MNKKHLIKLISAVCTLVLVCTALCSCSGKQAEQNETAASTDLSASAVSASSADSAAPTAAPVTAAGKTEKGAPVNGEGKAPDTICYVYYSSQKAYVYEPDLVNSCTLVQLKSGDSHKLNFFSPPKGSDQLGGIPVIFDFDHSQNPKTGYAYPDSLRITCTEGTFCMIVDGEIQNFSEPAQLGTGYGTVYWNPNGKGEAAKETELTAEYISAGKVISSVTAVITRDNQNTDDPENVIYSYKIKIK